MLIASLIDAEFLEHDILGNKQKNHLRLLFFSPIYINLP